MARKRGRVGFTLVELLVVIAIIGVLVALLLPAVQAARESARRMQCANNLKQMGLAFTNYHDTNKWFPPGAVWSNTGAAIPSPGNFANNRGSFFIRILPYVEQQSLYNLFDFNTGTDGQRLVATNASSELLRGQQLAVFICPSDTVRRTGNTPNFIMPASYHTNMGPSSDISNNGACSCPLHATFRTFSRPNTNVNNPAGPFSRNGWVSQTKMSDCLDGLSNTIYVGEARAQCSGHIAGGWSASNRWGAFTHVPINFDSCRTMAEAQTEGKDLCYANCNWNTEVGFKSLHPGGAAFVFGDGSVQFLQQNIDMKLYNLLGDKADKKAATVP
jgi:prepilin-type N-terminal cleavage/methylation domain-containing protein/prepilin-type processing-associated H-X9-DG protein